MNSCLCFVFFHNRYNIANKLQNGTEVRVDAEGMTILNPTGNTVWLLNEYPPQIIEFDFTVKAIAAHVKKVSLR